MLEKYLKHHKLLSSGTKADKTKKSLCMYLMQTMVTANTLMTNLLTKLQTEMLDFVSFNSEWMTSFSQN